MWSDYWLLYLALIGVAVLAAPLWLYARQQISWIRDGLSRNQRTLANQQSAKVHRARQMFAWFAITGWVALMVAVAFTTYCYVTPYGLYMLKDLWLLVLALTAVALSGFWGAALIKLAFDKEPEPFKNVAKVLNLGQLFFITGAAILPLARTVIDAQSDLQDWKGAAFGALAILLTICLWMVALVEGYVAFFTNLKISRRIKRAG